MCRVVVCCLAVCAVCLLACACVGLLIVLACPAWLGVCLIVIAMSCVCVVVAVFAFCLGFCLRSFVFPVRGLREDEGLRCDVDAVKTVSVQTMRGRVGKQTRRRGRATDTACDMRALWAHTGYDGA